MSLFIASLNSGSNGNCYYVGNYEEAILIDVGISARETLKRLERLGLDKKKIKAIFITHEHTDHIKGLYQLVKNCQWPVYITPRTLVESRLDLSLEVVRSFEANNPISIGQLKVTAFMKFHDAADPHSIVVDHGNTRVGVFTDIGQVCPQVAQYFKTCHAAFLEANYDEEMLDKGPYPYYLKRRIRGGKGHISNRQAVQLFQEHRHDELSCLILSHLSHQNNTPDIVSTLFKAASKSTKIVVASRFNETELYHVQDNLQENDDRTIPNKANRKKQGQLSLF